MLKINRTNIMDMYEVKMRFPFSPEESGGPGRGHIYFSQDVFRSCSEFFPHIVVWPSQEINRERIPLHSCAQRISWKFRCFLSDVFLCTWKRKSMLFCNSLFYLMYPGYLLVPVNIKLPLFIKKWLHGTSSCGNNTD